MGLSLRQIEKSTRDAACGSPEYHVIAAADGSEPLANDVDYIVDGYLPVVGSVQTTTILNQPDVPRVLTVTLTDANASIGSIAVFIYGRDYWNNAVKEIHRLRSTGTTEGLIGFRYVAQVLSVTTGVVTGGADTIEVGIGEGLALPVRIGAATDVTRKIAGGAADAGVIDVQWSTWTPEAGNQADAATAYEVEIMSTFRGLKFPGNYAVVTD
jgi:hypothetical protein